MGTRSRSFIYRILTVALVLSCDGTPLAPRASTSTSNDPNSLITSIVVVPAGFMIAPTQSIQLVAFPRAADGRLLSGQLIAWQSSDATIATVSSTGLLTALRVGDVVVTASGGVHTGVAAISVAPEPAAAITVTPSALRLLVGDTARLAGVVRDAAGAALDDRLVSWSSSNIAVASVSPTGLVTARASGVVTMTASNGDASKAVSVNVTAIPVASVRLDPTTVNLHIVDTRQVVAELRDASGIVLTGRAIMWTSDNTSIATVSSSGVVGAIALGTTQVTATSEGVSASAVVNVLGATDVKPQIIPDFVTAEVGEAVQLSARLSDASGSTVPNAQFSWATSDPMIATVSQTGLVTSIEAGDVIITISSGGKTAHALFRGFLARVSSLTVSGTGSNAIVGASMQFAAIARRANGEVITGLTARWATNPTGVAMINQHGLLTAIQTGTVTVSASVDSVVGTSTLVVTTAPVASVTVSPTPVTLNVGGSTLLVTQLRDTAGSTLNDRVVTWSSSTPGVAAVSSTGFVTAIAAGSTTISATSEGIRGTASVTVIGAAPPAPPASAPVAVVLVSPTTATVAIGQTTQLSATTQDASNNVLSGRVVAWTSSSIATATVSSSGLVTAVAAGSATITATSESRFGTAVITVPAPSTPPPPPTPTGTGECATPGSGWIWCDDFEVDRLTSYFEVDNNGGDFRRATGVGLSASTGMRALWQSGESSAGSLHLAFGKTPSAVFRAVDSGTQLYREVYWRMYVKNQAGWTGGGADDFSRALVLASANRAEAAMGHVWSGTGLDFNYLLIDPASGTDASGALKSTGYDDFANVRWLGEKRGTTPLFSAANVGQWYCVEMHMKLNDAGQTNGVMELWLNDQLEAQKTGLNWLGTYSTYGINAVFFENNWHSASPVQQERYFDNVVVSTQRIGCGSTPTTPAPPPPAPAPVATITLAPATATLTLGQSTQLSPTVRDGAGNALTGRVVTWTSSNTARATVSSSGLVTGMSAGSATITVTSEGIAATAAITVASVPVATVAVSPTAATITIGQTTQLTATMRDVSNNVLTGRVVTWTSSSAAVAGVASSGVVTAVAAGSATITATSEGRTATAAITVTALPTTPPPASGSGECGSPQSGWIWCDDFDTDRLSTYWEVDNNGGDFARTAAVGVNGSTGMRTRWQAGEVGAGALHLAFGKVPSASFRPVDGGTAIYREIYWRVYLRYPSTWQGTGPDKLSRASVFATSGWAQAAVGHLWDTDAATDDRLALDPVSGTTAAGALQTTQWNDFANFRWLGFSTGTTHLLDATHKGQWACIEAHMRLNDPQQSNGIFEFWVDGELNSRQAAINWLGSYSTYGINSVFLESYWNSGSPVQQERYFDNFVVSTSRIGCLGAATAPPPTSAPAPVATVSVSPGTVTLAIGQTGQLTTVTRDATGSALTGRAITWTSSSSATASVSSIGLVTAVAIGSAAITATSEGQTASAAITVTTPPSLQAVILTPATAAVVTGGTLQFSVSGQWSNGTVSAPAVTYSTAGGTITAGGLYAAGGTAGTYRVIATQQGGTLADTSTVTLTVPSLLGRNPNEPVGYTRIADQAFSSLTADGWNIEYGSPQLTTDATAPTSPLGIVRATYPSGFGSGSPPWVLERTLANPTSLYYNITFKHSANFQGQGSGTNKLGYVWINGGPDIFLSAEGTGSGNLTATARYQGGSDSREYFPPNQGQSGIITRNVWHTWEVQLIRNTPGASNGTYRWWLDGVLVGSYTDVKFGGAGESNVFQTISINPIWGGGVGQSVSNTMSIDFDHIYVSGK
jgi:uncharacterized protein YjdB